MSRHYHVNNGGTNLTSNTGAGATTTPVNAVPSITVPFYAAFDATNINGHYEEVEITGKTATNINHAATTYAHTTAEEVRFPFVATEADMFSAQLNGAAPLAIQAPQGFLINGKIVPSVASNNLTVSLKTLAGTDPSATDPVYVRIGDTVRTISAALSVAKADGTNWMNAGSAELATKEIDYFVYLGYNATDGVVLGFSRYPGANQYSDFSATTTNEKYCAISTITNADAADYYSVIGRFAATLSAGAGYTWSVPTYTASNLIQRPIYETRKLTYAPTITAGSGSITSYTATGTYKVVANSVRLYNTVTMTNAGTAGGECISTLPLNFLNERSPITAWEGAVTGYLCVAHAILSDLTKIGVSKYDFTTIWTTNRVLFIAGTYEI